jgi:hypothetical protein
LSRSIGTGTNTEANLIKYMEKYPKKTPANTKYTKYDKMKQMLPEGAVRQKMMIENFNQEEIDAYFSGDVASKKSTPESQTYSGEALKLTYKIYLHTTNKRLCVSVYSIESVQLHEDTTIYLVTNPISPESIYLNGDINDKFLDGVSTLYVRGGRRKTKRRTNRQYKPKTKTKNKKQTKRKRSKRRLY